MATMHWNYKDVLRAGRLGFSAKKIWMNFAGLFVGGAGYMLLTYTAYAASGIPLAAIWERFSLIPYLDMYMISPELGPLSIHWWSWAIWGVALAWFLFVALVTATAVAKVTFEQLRGDDFFDAKDAYRFAMERLGAIVSAPLMPILFAAVITVIGLVFSLVGAIPVLGELIVGLLAVPAFGASLFVVYLIVVFLFSLILTPAVVASTKNDAFDTLFEVFSCVNEQSWRLVVYTILVSVLTCVGTAILGWFSFKAIHLGSAVVQTFMGGKFGNIMSGADYYLRVSVPTWCPFYYLFASSNGFILGGDLLADGLGQNIAALLFGLGAYAVLLFVLGYGASVWQSGVMLTFGVLTRKKDDKDLFQETESDDLLAEEPEPKPAEAKPAPAS